MLDSNPRHNGVLCILWSEFQEEGASRETSSKPSVVASSPNHDFKETSSDGVSLQIPT
jgi:hypothetical protein